MNKPIKHRKQYRLSAEVIKAWEWLAKKDNISQTAALEQAVLAAFAHKKSLAKLQSKPAALKKQKELAKLFGKLRWEGDSSLKTQRGSQ